MKGLLMAVSLVGMNLGLAWAAPAKTTRAPAKAQTLAAGEYSAKVKAIVCGACVPMIEKTIKDYPGIESVSVDQEASSVRFKVKKGAKVNLAKLQQALAEEAGKMGMGADYRLLELSDVKAKQGAQRTDIEPGLTRVEARFVCMMNNRLFEKEQIPVEVGGQMYYGCCEGCKKSLQQNAGLRSAIDPASQKQVDKATAIIGARNDGTVLYFESADTMKSYLAAHAQ